MVKVFSFKVVSAYTPAHGRGQENSTFHVLVQPVVFEGMKKG